MGWGWGNPMFACGECIPFSEKAVDIINAYMFVLRAEYFSPPPFFAGFLRHCIDTAWNNLDTTGN